MPSAGDADFRQAQGSLCVKEIGSKVQIRSPEIRSKLELVGRKHEEVGGWIYEKALKEIPGKWAVHQQPVW